MRKTTIPGHKQSICGSVLDQGLYDLCFFGLQYISKKFNTFVIVVTCILQALVHEDPSYVVKRYESRKYAIDESVTNEYLKVRCLGCLNNPYPVYTAAQTSYMFIFPLLVRYTIIHVSIIS